MKNSISSKNIRKEQMKKLTKQLERELFDSLDIHNVTAARYTLAAINQIVNEEIKNK